MFETGFHILGISFSIFIYIFYVPNFRSNKKQGNVKKKQHRTVFLKMANIFRMCLYPPWVALYKLNLNMVLMS